MKASVTPSTTYTTPSGSITSVKPTTSGPVTIDTTGKLTGQSVDVIRNIDGSFENIARNLVSVTAASGQTTSSFIQTVSGNVSQTPVGVTPSTKATLTTRTALTGAGTGTIPGNISANVALTSTAVTPIYVTPGTGTMTAHIVGAVGGRPVRLKPAWPPCIPIKPSGGPPSLCWT
jgi:hypothetical protein